MSARAKKAKTKSDCRHWRKASRNSTSQAFADWFLCLVGTSSMSWFGSCVVWWCNLMPHILRSQVPMIDLGDLALYWSIVTPWVIYDITYLTSSWSFFYFILFSKKSLFFVIWCNDHGAIHVTWGSINGKKWPLLTDGPLEFEKESVEVEGLGKEFHSLYMNLHK